MLGQGHNAPSFLGVAIYIALPANVGPSRAIVGVRVSSRRVHVFPFAGFPTTLTGPAHGVSAAVAPKIHPLRLLRVTAPLHP